MMRDFKKLEIWKNGMELAVMCYDITRKLPLSEKYGLVSQMNRAAISVPSNIAEGNSRISDKDNRRFMEIALGSCNELETLLLLGGKLGLITEETILEVLTLLMLEQRQLWSFIQKLRLESQ